MYSSKYKPNLKDRNAIRESKIRGTFKKLTFAKVKAAPSEANCSLLLDDETVKFVKTMMKEGKRYIHGEVLRRTFEIIKDTQLKKLHKPGITKERQANIVTDPQVILKTAVENARPLLEIQNIRKAGIVYQVPAPIEYDKSLFEARLRNKHILGHRFPRNRRHG